MSDHQRQPIAPGMLYPTSVLIRDLGISANTLAKWRKRGLKWVPGEKLGTRSDYYWSDDVVSFIRACGNESKAKK